MKEMRELWTRVEHWVDTQPALPPSEAVFGPPARAAQIEAAEQAVGRIFSESFRASLLVHDGQFVPGTGRRSEDEIEWVRWLPNQMVLLPLRDILATWREERAFEAENASAVEGISEETADDDRVRAFPTVTHAGRLPIAGQEASAYMYLDFVPDPAGALGQVILTKNECDFSVAGEDFQDFLARYVDLLERGVLRYDADTYHSVIPADPRVAFDSLIELRVV
ncbi:SMI1/KNR4 family protein [Nonomuraea sp. NPDC049709]|uniref:SMI1/KNR4 family protein n=1 Tax=Nonomuraea sp. NPDC049709 TaxID=3154736 RepID=UPI00342B21F5